MRYSDASNKMFFVVRVTETIWHGKFHFREQAYGKRACMLHYKHCGKLSISGTCIYGVNMARFLLRQIRLGAFKEPVGN